MSVAALERLRRSLDGLDAPPTHLVLFGEVVHPTPLAETDPAVLELYEDLEDLLAIPMAELAAERFDAAVLLLWVSGLLEWARDIVERFDELALAGGEEEWAAALIAGGAVHEGVARMLSEMPVPSDLADDPDGEAVFREKAMRHAAEAALRGRGRFLDCAATVGPPWDGVCAERAEALGDLSREARGSEPAEPAGNAMIVGHAETVTQANMQEAPPKLAPHSPAAAGRPDGCGEPTFNFSFADPDAPPPDVTAEPVLAVVPGRLPLEGPEREAFLADLGARLSARTGLPLVDREEVRRAEALVSERRWRDGGPVCGQAPPLPAILAEAHPFLVVARVGTEARLRRRDPSEPFHGRLGGHRPASRSATSCPSPSTRDALP